MTEQGEQSVLDYAAPKPQPAATMVLTWTGKIALFLFSIPWWVAFVTWCLYFFGDGPHSRDRPIALMQGAIVLTIGILAAAPLGKWLICKCGPHPRSLHQQRLD